MIKKFNEYTNEELDASTVGLVGSGTAITGYPTGTYTPAAGVSVYGGDSESSFAANSSGAKGMEQEVICPPKNIFREPIVKKRRKNKKERLNNQIGATIDTLSKPVLKVNEDIIVPNHTDFICQVNSVYELDTVIAEVMKISNIKTNLDTVRHFSTYPNWLFIEVYNNPKQINLNRWGDYLHYEETLVRVKRRFTRRDTFAHIFNYGELPDLMRNIRTHLGIVPNYTPKSIRMNEAVGTKYHRTIICQFADITEAYTVINKIKQLPSAIAVSHNETIASLGEFPNWLFIEIEPTNKIYINYWGDGNGYESNLEDVMDSLTRTDTDHHLYNHSELPIIIKNIRSYYEIPEVPNYNPRKRNYENMKTFNEFNKLNEDYLSIGNTVKITYPEHKDVDKIGIITARDGDFLTVDMGTHTIKINASSIVDLNEGILNEDEGSGGVSTATLGNTGGMGDIVSAQPSNTPGDVAGSTKGSGDIARTALGPYSKIPIRKKNKKDKRSRPYSKIGAGIDNFYVTKYAQGDPNSGGRVIQSWKTFTDTK